MNSKPVPFFRRYWVPAVVSLVILFVLSLLIRQSITAQAIRIPTPTISIDSAIIGLEKQLQSNNIDNEYRHILETKVAVLNNDATRVAIGRAKIPAYQPTLQLPPIETENPNSDRLMGIIDYPSVPFSTMEVLIENAWQGKINNEFVLVFAGATRFDPQKGVLIVATEHPLNFNYIYLSGTGSMKITGFNGLQLIIQSKTKGIVYFDVPGQTVIKSLGEYVPTVTPFSNKKLQPTLSLKTATPGLAYP